MQNNGNTTNATANQSGGYKLIREQLRELQDEVAAEKNIRVDALRRMIAKVEEYSESHRAHGLPDELLSILKDDLAECETEVAEELI